MAAHAAGIVHRDFKPHNDGLIRLSVGLEATQDLIDDFAAALG